MDAMLFGIYSQAAFSSHNAVTEAAKKPFERRGQGLSLQSGLALNSYLLGLKK